MCIKYVLGLMLRKNAPCEEPYFVRAEEKIDNKEAIIALYEMAREETTRFRDYALYLTIWSVSALAGSVYLLKETDLKESGLWRILITIFIIAYSIFTIFFLLRHCHANVINNRRLIRICEINLNLNELVSNAYKEWGRSISSIKFNDGVALIIYMSSFVILVAFITLYYVWSR